MKTFLPLLLFVFTSCFSQNSTSLTFVNKSSLDIDSIVILIPEKIIIGKVAVGQQYLERISNIELNTNNEGAFPFTVYQRGKILTATWGFHDFGMLSSKNEIFYIYDNGITSTDKPMQKPKEFRLYFYNASSQTIDSFININGEIVKVIESSPRSFEVVYDYDKMEKLNELSVIINGERKSSKIDHDFDNWNISQTFFHYENDSIKKGSLPWREPLEFQFDLEVKLPIPSDSVKVESIATVKTYYFKQPNYLKVVFDFKKLRQNPIFKVKASDKEYIVDLSSHDFSNIYSHQLIYYLDNSGIRSKMY